MKTFAIQFEGYWPVGAVAIVVAEDKDSAVLLMRSKLNEMKLNPEQEITDEDITEIDPNTSGVYVLLDGNY